MKQGDIIICINNKSDLNSNSTEVSLTIGRSYKVKLLLHLNTTTQIDIYDFNIDVINDDGDIGQYRAQRFTTLENWRELQLNKILL